MQRILLILLVILFGNQLSKAQNKLVKIEGKIVDSVLGTNLPNTHIILIKKQGGTISDQNGSFTLFTNKLPETLHFSRIGYQMRIVQLPQNSSDTFLTIRLIPDTITLQEAVIGSKKNIYNHQTNNYTILDYTIIDSNILILQNKHGLRKNKSLVLLNAAYDTLATANIVPAKALSFFDDCLGNTHLITTDSAYQIWIYKKQIRFLKPVGLKRFYATLNNCLLMKDSCLFYKKSMMADLGEEIYVFSSKNKKPKLFIKSYDKKRYERYINDILHISGMYRGHDIPISSVENDSLLMSNIHKYEVENRFLREIVYSPVYNRLLSIHDTLIYFNHINGTIDFYSFALKQLKSIPITYQKSKKWKNTILKDKVTNKTYTIFQNAGYFVIYEVNYNNGTIHRINRLPMFETSKISVSNGYLYYLRKESNLGSTTVTKLYRKKF